MAPAASKPSGSDVALQAAIDGNLGLLKKMAKKVNLREAKDDRGRNALHLVAAKGHLEVCRFLVEELGLDVNSTSSYGSSPLHFAGTEGGESVLRYLVGRGGNPGMPDQVGRTPLHDAAAHGNCEAVSVLLSMGVDVDAVSNRGATPLHLAAASDYDQVMKVLLEHGADPNKVSKFDYSPLLLACCENSLKCSNLLVEAGADVNFISASGQSVLMMAVRYGSFDSVKFLVEAGADPNIAGKDGKIPIMVAALHRKRELVKILFPLTRPIPSVMDWITDGVIRSMEYLPFEPQITDYQESKGKEAFEKGQYLAAANFCGAALVLKPFDATLFAKRSLCWLRLRDGGRTLTQLFKGAVDAFAEALKLCPSSKKIEKALRKAKITNPKSKGNEAFEKGHYLIAADYYGEALVIDPFNAALFAKRSLCWLRLRDGDKALLDAQFCKMSRPRWAKAWHREGAALSFSKNHKGALDAFAEALKLDPSSKKIKISEEGQGVYEDLWWLRRTRPWISRICSLIDISDE
ncbi:unnamed protein product [Urochloa decumbens]|uniref:Uncharacterized protein n=1 Tax=Urochloa decumbens TaxID=240449 RepID=A0ABC9GEX9_9POAL